MNKKNNLIIITAPSGTGKSTLIRRLMKDDKNLVFSVSHTTREKRDDEKDGVHYHFVTKKEFKKMINKKAFLEWAEVHDNYYGTSIQEIDKNISGSKKVVLDIDVQGSLDLKKQNIEGLYIFITVTDLNELKKRLLQRNQNTPEDMNIRLKNAEWELEQKYNWSHIVINDQLEKAVRDLKNIIYAKN